jgi:putative two-component system response regulator
MPAGARILVVDDEAPMRDVLTRILESNGYHCSSAGDTTAARRLLAEDAFSLILCDVTMPGESGLELIKNIIPLYEHTAVVMISGIDDPAMADTVFEIGAYGYLIKPFTVNQVLVSVSNALRRLALETENRQYAQSLERTILERTELLSRTLRQAADAQERVRSLDEEAIHRLARVLEFRDLETHRHTERMSAYSQVLASRLGLHRERCELIRLGAIMHDIGKVAVPDAVLFKQGPLDDAEWETIRRHPSVGHQILVGWTGEIFSVGAIVALTHHERWNGSGYPLGLRGAAIPHEGRIVAVADAFDAMTSDRPYRSALTLEHAEEILESERGEQFDPDVVDVFVEAMATIVELHGALHD